MIVVPTAGLRRLNRGSSAPSANVLGEALTELTDGAKTSIVGLAYVIAYKRMAAVAASNAPIGPRVRALREAMDLSLRDLAERSGVSAPMLSQVERGETSPTLAVAERIAEGLELRLSQLLRLDEDGVVSIVRASERRRGGSRRHRYELLTPPLPGQRAEVSRHELAAGDCVTFDADLPHHFENPGEEPATLLAVVSAGLRRS